jgi:hypothetical protein
MPERRNQMSAAVHRTTQNAAYHGLLIFFMIALLTCLIPVRSYADALSLPDRANAAAGA